MASREDVKAQVEALEKARKEARARAEKLETAGERAAARAAALAAEGQELKDRVAALVRQLVAIEEENKRIAALLADALAARNALGKEASELGRVRVGLDEKIKALVKKIAQLDAENRRLVQQLEAERKGGAEAEARVADLTGRQAALERERADLARQLADLRDKNAQLRANLAAALRDHNSLGKTAGALREEQGRLIARLAEVERARNRLRKLLAAAQKEGKGLGAKLGAADRQIAEMRSVSATQARQVLLLTQQLIALRRQLLSIQEALDVSEAQGKQQQLKISNLDQRLKAALVRQVNELKQYKSEFFGELRKTLGTRQDVRIVGDRFVFPSSVLFATNSSALQEGGKVEMRKLAATLKELAKKIPRRYRLDPAGRRPHRCPGVQGRIEPGAFGPAGDRRGELPDGRGYSAPPPVRRRLRLASPDRPGRYRRGLPEKPPDRNQTHPAVGTSRFTGQSDRSAVSRPAACAPLPLAS